MSLMQQKFHFERISFENRVRLNSALQYVINYLKKRVPLINQNYLTLQGVRLDPEDNIVYSLLVHDLNVVLQLCYLPGHLF